MEHDFWHDKWENNQIGFHQSQPNPLLTEYISALNLGHNARIFVPLCGKTLDIGWLLSQGYQVVGAELNESAVRQLFEELGVSPTIEKKPNSVHFKADNIDIFQGDFFTLKSTDLGRVDAVYDRAALVAMPEHMREGYTQQLLLITQSVQQLVICYQYDQSQLDGPPFSITDTELARHYEASFTMNNLASLEVEGGFKGQFPALEKIWLLNP